MATKNLGMIAAVFEGNSPPSNTSLVWIDTSGATPVRKVYDFGASAWRKENLKFSKTITGDGAQNAWVLNHQFNTEEVFCLVQDPDNNKVNFDAISFQPQSPDETLVAFNTPPPNGKNYKIILKG